MLMAGAHIDRTAVQRWEHRILSDAVARRYDAVARRYPTGVLAVTAPSLLWACPCENRPLTRAG